MPLAHEGEGGTLSNGKELCNDCARSQFAACLLPLNACLRCRCVRARCDIADARGRCDWGDRCTLLVRDALQSSTFARVRAQASLSTASCAAAATAIKGEKALSG